jgi:hypothetical protein
MLQTCLKTDHIMKERKQGHSRIRNNNSGGYFWYDETPVQRKAAYTELMKPHATNYVKGRELDSNAFSVSLP